MVCCKCINELIFARMYVSPWWYPLIPCHRAGLEKNVYKVHNIFIYKSFMVPAGTGNSGGKKFGNNNLKQFVSWKGAVVVETVGCHTPPVVQKGVGRPAGSIALQKKSSKRILPKNKFQKELTNHHADNANIQRNMLIGPCILNTVLSFGSATMACWSHAGEG